MDAEVKAFVPDWSKTNDVFVSRDGAEWRYSRHHDALIWMIRVGDNSAWRFFDNGRIVVSSSDHDPWDIVSQRSGAVSDGGEEWTDDWLRTLGFVATGDSSLRLPLSGDFFLCAYKYCAWSIDTKDTSASYYGCSHSLDISQPKTRTEVLAVLAALKVTVPGE